METKKYYPYICGMIMAFVFGLTFLFSKTGLAYMSPMMLLSCRFFIAAVFMSMLLLCGIIHVDFRGKPVYRVVVLSVFYPMISFLFETVGLQWTSTAQAGIMVSLMPVFVAFLGAFFLKERQNKKQIFFIFCSVIGVLVTIIFSKQGEDGTQKGLLLLLCSIVAGSVYNILSRKNAAIFTPVEITFIMIWLGAIFFTAIFLWQAMHSSGIAAAYKMVLQEPTAIFSVVYLGIFASVLAFFCMNYMLGKLPAANACIFNNMATVISIFAGILVLHEKMHWYQMVGGILIISGVWGTNYYEGKG